MQPNEASDWMKDKGVRGYRDKYEDVFLLQGLIMGGEQLAIKKGQKSESSKSFLIEGEVGNPSNESKISPQMCRCDISNGVFDADGAGWRNSRAPLHGDMPKHPDGTVIQVTEINTIRGIRIEGMSPVKWCMLPHRDTNTIDFQASGNWKMSTKPIDQRRPLWNATKFGSVRPEGLESAPGPEWPFLEHPRKPVKYSKVSCSKGCTTNTNYRRK